MSLSAILIIYELNRGLNNNQDMVRPYIDLSIAILFLLHLVLWKRFKYIALTLVTSIIGFNELINIYFIWKLKMINYNNISEMLYYTYKGLNAIDAFYITLDILILQLLFSTIAFFVATYTYRHYLKI